MEPWNDAADQRRAIRANNAVVHWFKSDLRLYDNRALRMAYQTAKEHNIPLTGLYVLSPQDLTAHLLTPARVDLILRILHQLKRHWSEPDIPLCIEAQNVRKSIPQRIVDLCQHWGANHRYRNLEYEVDELQREKLVRLCAKNGINFETAHDARVVLRGQVTSQQGKQYAVYSPWYRSWLAYLNENPDCLEHRRSRDVIWVMRGNTSRNYLTAGFQRHQRTSSCRRKRRSG